MFGTCYVILYRGILYPSRGQGKKMEILPIPKLMKVADYFGVSVDYLLGRTENREINR